MSPKPEKGEGDKKNSFVYVYRISFCSLFVIYEKKKKNHEERNSTLAKPYLITEILFIAIYIEVALIIYFFIIL